MNRTKNTLPKDVARGVLRAVALNDCEECPLYKKECKTSGIDECEDNIHTAARSIYGLTERRCGNCADGDSTEARMICVGCHGYTGAKGPRSGEYLVKWRPKSGVPVMAHESQVLFHSKKNVKAAITGSVLDCIATGGTQPCAQEEAFASKLADIYIAYAAKEWGVKWKD